MNELQGLATLRAGMPDPSSDAMARARRRLLHHAVGSRVARPRRSARRAVAGGLAAALIAAGAVVVGTVGWGGAVPAAAQEASDLLRSASMTAGIAPAATVEPGQYIYVHRAGFGTTVTGAVSYQQRFVQETWLSPDGDRSGHTLVTYGAVTYLGDGSARGLAAYGVQPPTPGSQRRWTIPPAQAPSDNLAFPSYQFLRSLPTDPDQLYSVISDYAQSRGVSGSQQMLDTVATLLSWSVAPPALRAALYEITARIPGIEALGAAVDASGRRGTALEVTVAGTRYELIFDPATSQLLGTRNVIDTDATGQFAPGTVLADEAIESSVVSALGATPPSAAHQGDGGEIQLPR